MKEIAINHTTLMQKQIEGYHFHLRVHVHLLEEEKFWFELWRRYLRWCKCWRADYGNFIIKSNI